jgi:hypothetical protein
MHDTLGLVPSHCNQWALFQSAYLDILDLKAFNVQVVQAKERYGITDFKTYTQKTWDDLRLRQCHKNDQKQL